MSTRKLLRCFILFFVPFLSMAFAGYLFRVLWLGIAATCVMAALWTVAMSGTYLKLFSVNDSVTLVVMWVIASVPIYLLVQFFVFEHHTPIISPLVVGGVWFAFALMCPLFVWRLSPSIYAAYTYAKEHKLLTCSIPPPLAYAMVLFSSILLCYFYVGYVYLFASTQNGLQQIGCHVLLNILVITHSFIVTRAQHKTTGVIDPYPGQITKSGHAIGNSRSQNRQPKLRATSSSAENSLTNDRSSIPRVVARAPNTSPVQCQVALPGSVSQSRAASRYSVGGDADDQQRPNNAGGIYADGMRGNHSRCISLPIPEHKDVVYGNNDRDREKMMSSKKMANVSMCVDGDCSRAKEAEAGGGGEKMGEKAKERERAQEVEDSVIRSYPAPFTPTSPRLTATRASMMDAPQWCVCGTRHCDVELILQLWILYLFALGLTTVAFVFVHDTTTLVIILAMEQVSPAFRLLQVSSRYWTLRDRVKHWPFIGLVFDRQITQECFKQRQSLHCFFTCFSIASASALTAIIVPFSRASFPDVLPYSYLSYDRVIRIEMYCAAAALCALLQLAVADILVRQIYDDALCEASDCACARVPRPLSAGMKLFARRFWQVLGVLANVSVMCLMVFPKEMDSFAHFFPEKYVPAP